MPFSRVKLSVETAALTALLVSAPAPLEAQASGILQATARVVDYGTSLAALKMAGTAVSVSQGRVRVETTSLEGLHIAAYRRSEGNELEDEPLVLTISYLR